MRGTIHFGGWVLKPNKSEPNKTEATYMIEIDLGVENGKEIPKWVLS